MDVLLSVLAFPFSFSPCNAYAYPGVGTFELGLGWPGVLGWAVWPHMRLIVFWHGPSKNSGIHGSWRFTEHKGEWRYMARCIGFLQHARLMRRLRVQRATVFLVASEMRVFFFGLPAGSHGGRGLSDQSSMTSKSWTRRGLGDAVLPGLHLLPQEAAVCH